MSFQCAFCDSSVKTKAILMMHIKNKHPQEFTENLEDSPTSSSAPAPSSVSAPAPSPAPVKTPSVTLTSTTHRGPINFNDDDDDEDVEFPGGPSAKKPSATPAAPVAATSSAASSAAAPKNEQPKGMNPTAPTFQPPKKINAFDDSVEESMQAVSLETPKAPSNSLLHGTQNVQVRYASAHPNAELYTAAKSFEQLNLSPELLKGLYAMGFNRPSKIQETALPLLLNPGPDGKYNNMIAQSQSGTGKTAAFALTLLSRVNPQMAFTQGLCLTNARELAQQVAKEIARMGQFSTVKVFAAVGGSGDHQNAHIVVGTPGVISQLIMERKIDPRKISVFVLDEADVMVDSQNLGDQSTRLRKLLTPTCQILLFSATFPEHVSEFARKLVPNAVELSLKREELTVDAIGQYFISTRNKEEKFRVLFDLYALLHVGSGIIFCQTKADAGHIYESMRRDGFQVSLLSTDLKGYERDQMMEDFRNSKTKVIVATNAIARGVDISQVTLVVNFDLPVGQDRLPDYEVYLHRIGRTGRFGRTGTAINLIDDQSSFRVMKEFERYFNTEIKELPADLEGLERALEDIRL